jgi:site-specific recombinase XerD
VVLKEETYQMLLEFIGDRTEGALFMSSRSGSFMSGGEVSRIIKTIFKRCGIDSSAIVAHSLRTTFCVMCVEAGVPLVNISKAMNHASSSTTDRYLKSYNKLSQPAEDSINIMW